MAKPLRFPVADDSEKYDVIYIPYQFTYDIQNLSRYSPDYAADIMFLTIVNANRAFGGPNVGWTDMPIAYTAKQLHISYRRLKDSLDRLVDLGVVEAKNIGVHGATPKVRYTNRGKTASQYELPAFEKMVPIKPEPEEVQVVETPKPKAVEEPKPTDNPLTETIDSWRAKQAERGIDVSHYATERGGLTLKGYIYVESVDDSNKPVWKNLPIQEFTKDMSKYAACVRCGRTCAKELLNSDSICEICKTEL